MGEGEYRLSVEESEPWTNVGTNGLGIDRRRCTNAEDRAFSFLVMQ